MHSQWGKWKHSLKELPYRILLPTAKIHSMWPTTITYHYEGPQFIFAENVNFNDLGQTGKLVELLSAK